MQAVMRTEQKLGFTPRDVSALKCGYDIEWAIPGTGLLRFLEVKGRITGADTVTVSKNEILTALNKPDNFILALVEVPFDPDFSDRDAYRGIAEEGVTYQASTPLDCRVRYLWRPFAKEPDFGATLSVG